MFTMPLSVASAHPPPSSCRIDQVDPATYVAWLEVLARGNDIDDPAQRATSDEFSAANAVVDGNVDLVASIDRQIVGCGSIHVDGGVAWLGRAATLPGVPRPRDSDRVVARATPHGVSARADPPRRLLCRQDRRRATSRESDSATCRPRWWCRVIGIEWRRPPAASASAASATRSCRSPTDRRRSCQTTRTCWASSPFLPGATTNSTVSPSLSELVALTLDVGEVHEHVGAALSRDEAEALSALKNFTVPVVISFSSQIR